MPRLITNNHVKTQKQQGTKNIEKLPAFTTAYIFDIIYILGGITFLVGSLLQFPHIDAFGQYGMVLFIIGSVLYLVITGYQSVEAIKNYKGHSERKIWTRLRIIESLLYLIGTVLFLIGSVMFLDVIGETVIGAELFVIGSVNFAVAAVINIMEIINEEGFITMQLANGIAISFVLGSVLFILGSIPFIWQGEDLAGSSNLYRYVIWEYIVGSFLFLLGGVLAYIKTAVIIKDKKS